jgi:hypothetical protein
LGDNASRRIGKLGIVLALVVLAVVTTHPIVAQNVSGRLFEDRDGDGVLDPGEPLLPGIEIDLAGTQDGGTPLAQTTFSGADGVFAFASGDGCYLLAPPLPPGRCATRSFTTSAAAGSRSSWRRSISPWRTPTSW